MTAPSSRIPVLILSAFPESAENFVAKEARAWLTACPNGAWRIADSPAAADVILFLEHHPGLDPLFLRVWLHPWRRRWPEKCWLFHDADHVFPLVPGVYPGLERQQLKSGFLTGWIYLTQFCQNPAVQFAPLTGNEKYLYSFTGAARTHPVRREILKIRDERAWLQDTSHQNGWELAGQAQTAYHHEYARLMQDSKFVLCPRGISPTSYRLLEAMQTGRAPVIISDAWPLPDGLPWNDFALVVPEADVPRLPQMLREREPDAPRLGAAAREVWIKFCEGDARFARFFERLSLLADARPRARFRTLHTWFQVLKSKKGLRALWHSIKNRR